MADLMIVEKIFEKYFNHVEVENLGKFGFIGVSYYHNCIKIKHVLSHKLIDHSMCPELYIDIIAKRLMQYKNPRK